MVGIVVGVAMVVIELFLYSCIRAGGMEDRKIKRLCWKEQKRQGERKEGEGCAG